VEQRNDERLLHLDEFCNISAMRFNVFEMKGNTYLLTFLRLRQSPIVLLVLSVREVQDGLLDLLLRPHSKKRGEERFRSTFGRKECQNGVTVG
jgi:hypothetical protein